MPNWCSNTLTVTGPMNDVALFVKITQNPSSIDPDEQRYTIAQRFIPFPKELEKTEQHISPSGEVITYGVLTDEASKWQNDNWGIKWGDCHTNVIDHTNDYKTGFGKAIYLFNTPWGPMLPAINTISKKWPTLSFVNTWDESGMCFMGAASFVNGKCLFKGDVQGAAYPECSDWDDQDAVDAYINKGEELVGNLKNAALASIAQ